MKRVETLRPPQAGVQTLGMALSLRLRRRLPLAGATAFSLGLTAQQLRALSCQAWKG